jgi:predicted DNA-binding transcriptional regulator AlpA
MLKRTTATPSTPANRHERRREATVGRRDPDDPFAHRRGDRLISTKELAALYHCSRSTIWRKRKTDPSFPRPVRARGTHHGWWESEAYAWLQSKQDAVAA